MKIRPDDANLSDLLRRFNLPLPVGTPRAAGTGTNLAPAIPKPAGSQGTPGAPGTPATPATPGTPATSGGTAQPAAPGGTAQPALRPNAGGVASAPATPAQPDLGALLDAVGGFELAGATAEGKAQLLAPERRSQVRASERPAQQPANGRAAPPEGADEGSRFISRVAPQVLPRPGQLAAALPKGAPDARPALPAEARPTAEARPDVVTNARSEASVERLAPRAEAQPALAQAEARVATELPRRELLLRGETADLRTELAAPPAQPQRATALEIATMQHWAAVEVSARNLPRNVRGDLPGTPSDPPKKGGRGRGGASASEWSPALVARSSAYAIAFTLLGLLAVLVLARACSF